MIFPGAPCKLQTRAISHPRVAVVRRWICARIQQCCGHAKLELRGGLAHTLDPLGGAQRSVRHSPQVNEVILRPRAEQLERRLPADARHADLRAVLDQQPDHLHAAPEPDRGAERPFEAAVPERLLGCFGVCLDGEAHLLRAVSLEGQKQGLCTVLSELQRRWRCRHPRAHTRRTWWSRPDCLRRTWGPGRAGGRTLSQARRLRQTLGVFRGSVVGVAGRFDGAHQRSWQLRDVGLISRVVLSGREKRPHVAEAHRSQKVPEKV